MDEGLLNFLSKMLSLFKQVPPFLVWVNPSSLAQ